VYLYGEAVLDVKNACDDLDCDMRCDATRKSDRAGKSLIDSVSAPLTMHNLVPSLSLPRFHCMLNMPR
jgi:hypothetical protein